MVHLRELLINQCMHEFAEIAHHHHYHDYRTRLLRRHGRHESFMMCDEGYDQQMAQLKNESDQMMSRREEEMRQQFVELVRTTEEGLKQREQEVTKIALDNLTHTYSS